MLVIYTISMQPIDNIPPKRDEISVEDKAVVAEEVAGANVVKGYRDLEKQSVSALPVMP